MTENTVQKEVHIYVGVKYITYMMFQFCGKIMFYFKNSAFIAWKKIM